MKMSSLLVAAALFSSIPVTYAAEPVTLTDTQLDKVVAGATATWDVTAGGAGPSQAGVSVTGDIQSSYSLTEGHQAHVNIKAASTSG